MNPLNCLTKKTMACTPKRSKQTFLHHFLLDPFSYFSNFPKFEERVNEEYQKRIQDSNIKAQQDFEEIFKNTKEYADKTWQHHSKDNNTSYITRTFTFQENDAVNFINIIKDKANEADHHPEWSLNGNTLEVKLTTHDNKNNVSFKDYELAAYMSLVYEESGHRYDKTKMCYLKYLTAFGLLFASTYLMISLYELKTKQHFTSDDFIFSRIDKSAKH